MSKSTKVYEKNLSDFVQDENNANKGTARGGEALAESISKLGPARSIVADANDRIPAGNKTLQTLVNAGFEKALVVETDGTTPVIVKRTDWDLSDPNGAARQYAFYDNRVAEMDLDWNKDELKKALANGVDLSGLWNERELAALLGRKQLIDEAGPTDGMEPRAELGSVFRLGRHILVCGDSTDLAVVDAALQGRKAQLANTDPPWNVAIGTNTAYGDKKKYRAIENDALGIDFPEFLRKTVASIHHALVPGGAVYCVMSTSEWPAVDFALRGGGFYWSATIIWVKDRLILSARDYHTQFEPIWYGWKEGAGRIRPVLDRKQSDVWEIPRPFKSEDHPTMKPIELCARAIQNSETGDLVFEPFNGSGSTLMACEQLGRSCAAIELAPQYVDSTLRRWETFTGKKAERLK